ncbi:MAG: Na+/H+ antiporter NhaC family protein [Xanthomonadales bacterium]|jgi:Na+/H+ antiporter NhaC|nr:Na+/H+ antiporter NhaC family protein [Xanthomonadales bacterium]
MNADWLTVLPPVVAIAVVLWRREVIVALVLAVFTSELLLQSGFLPGAGLAFLATLERTAAVFSDADNARILMFSILIGALIAFMKHSGGVTALVNAVVNRGIARNARQASLLTSLVGTAVFVESNLSVLTAGILSRGLFDRFGLSRAKLAYLIDSTSAPICILILLNGWGAYILVLLGQYEFQQSAAEILWGTVTTNFYALVTLLIVFLTAWTGKTFGPLARSEANLDDAESVDIAIEPSHPSYMLLPLLVMIVSMVGFMFWTGNGTLAEGSGSRSVLYAVSLACLVAYVMMLSSRRFSHVDLVRIGFDGMSELLPLVSIVLFSLALGASLKDLGTGTFIAGLTGEFLPRFLIVPMLFVAGALISFSTGTSWGTFAILIPIGMPLASSLGLPPSLVLSAILGGGVFGDHCSPISDTTCVSAIASGCDLLEHVRTQLPYALTAGGIAVLLYLLVGLVAP